MEPRFSPFQGERGFTLVELMVVVAVAAALIGFTYTGFSGTLERQRCQAAVKRITWLLKQAQMQAIEKHTSCTVKAITGNSTIQIFLDPDEDLAFGTDHTMLESVNIAQEFQGVQITGGGNFRFNNRGIPRPIAPPTIRLTPQDSSLGMGNVTISSMGRINVQMPEGWNY